MSDPGWAHLQNSPFEFLPGASGLPQVVHHIFFCSAVESLIVQKLFKWLKGFDVI